MRTPPPTLLVAAGAFLAALMDLNVGLVQAEGLPGVAVALTCGLVGTLVLGATRCGKRAGKGKPVPPRWLYALAALLGGIGSPLAFFAIPRVGLAVAECLMFTQPLFTGLFTALLDRNAAPWGARDFAVALVSLAGVALVARPWDGEMRTQWAGLLAAVGFGARGGLYNALLNTTALRSADATLLVLFGCVVATLLSALEWAAAECTGSGWSAQLAAAFGARAVAVSWRLGLVTMLNLVVFALTTLGLQRAHSTVVATLLYTQVAWGFLFAIAVDGARPEPEQYVGAVLIVGATALPPLLKARRRQRGGDEPAREHAALDEPLRDPSREEPRASV